MSIPDVTIEQAHGPDLLEQHLDANTMTASLIAAKLWSAVLPSYGQYKSTGSCRLLTKVCEGIDSQTGGWFNLVALQFVRLTGSEMPCTMYESRAGDETLHPHFDTRFGVILQMHGTKQRHGAFPYID